MTVSSIFHFTIDFVDSVIILIIINSEILLTAKQQVCCFPTSCTIFNKPSEFRYQWQLKH